MTEIPKDEADYPRLLTTAVEQVDEAIVITDPDGLIRYVNPAFERINGYTRREITGRSIELIKSERSDPALHKKLAKALRRGEHWSGRLVQKRQDGTDYEANVTISPVRDPSGSIVHYVSVSRDATQELALEAQLRQAQKLESIGQLAAGIAHEINTPIQYVGDNTRFIQDSLGGILALLGLYGELMDAVRAGSPSPELIERIEEMASAVDVEFMAEEIPRAIAESLEGIERVRKIVRAMKEFSHPGTQEKVKVDINKAIETTLTVSRNVWKYTAQVKTDFDPELPLVPCLPGDLNQVLLNLIVNASHAIADVVGDGSKGKGTIHITTRRDGDWAEIRIQDTGTGIPEAIRSRIFDPFFTTKEVGKGTGQGLAISHSVIVEKHGGTIHFETEMGKGTAFILRLPISPATAEEPCEDAA